MPDEWYYTQDGRGHGPVSEARLEELLAAGQLRPNDILWMEGMTQKIKVEALLAAEEGPETPPSPAEQAKTAGPPVPPPAVPDRLEDAAGAEPSRAAGRQPPPAASRPLDWQKDAPPPRSPPQAATEAAEPAAGAAEPAPPAEPAADVDVELQALAADFAQAAAQEKAAAERPAPAPAQPRQRGPGRLLLVANLLLSTAAVALALLALALHFWANPLGPGLAGYDLSTPRAALVSRLQMQQRKDIRAALELQALTEGDKFREKLDTLEVEREVEWKGGTILFIAFQQDGVRRHSAVGFERDARTGYWLQVPLNLDRVRAADPDLAKHVESWESEGRF
jgi:hypothetical protein